VNGKYSNFLFCSKKLSFLFHRETQSKHRAAQSFFTR